MKAYILHHTAGSTNAWDNLVATYNTDFNPGLYAGNGKIVGTIPESTRVYFFQKVDSRLILTAGPESNLMFVRPYTEKLSAPMTVNFSDIDQAIEAAPDHTVIFGTPLDEATNPDRAHGRARFFYREETGSIFDIKENRLIDAPEYSLVPWFFASKYGDTDIYFIVINYNAVQSVASLDGRYEIDEYTGDIVHQDIDSIEELYTREEKPGDYCVFTLDNHTPNIADLIMNMKFSSNVRIIGDTILVSGSSFSFKPFDNYFMNSYAYNMSKDLKIKVHSNFEHSINAEQQEVTVNLEGKGNVGYLIARVRTGPKKYAKYFYNAKNVLTKEYVIHRIED